MEKIRYIGSQFLNNLTERAKYGCGHKTTIVRLRLSFDREKSRIVPVEELPSQEIRPRCPDPRLTLWLTNGVLVPLEFEVDGGTRYKVEKFDPLPVGYEEKGYTGQPDENEPHFIVTTDHGFFELIAHPAEHKLQPREDWWEEGESRWRWTIKGELKTQEVYKLIKQRDQRIATKGKVDIVYKRVM